MTNNDLFLETQLSDKTFRKVTDSLASENGIALDVKLDSDAEISPELLKEMMAKPVPFEVEENGELSVTINNEKHVLDPKNKNLKEFSEDEDRLFMVLPDLVWDIYCSGMKRKQQEVVAAYKIIVVNSALGGLYQARLNEVVSNYDFETLRSRTIDGSTFSQLLTLVEQDAGSVVKFLLSCCSLKITAKKLTEEKPSTGILLEEDVKWLSNIQEQISLLESKVSKNLANEPSKLERLKMISEKDSYVEELVKNEIGDNVRRNVIYKISTLTSDSLPSRWKFFIKETSRKEVGKLLENGIISDSDVYDKLLKKVSRRAIRLAVRTLQKEKFEQLMLPDSNLDDILPKI